MELAIATSLLRKAIVSGAHLQRVPRPTQTWADLGAGRGLFTTALSQLLPGGSSIIAIDKDFDTRLNRWSEQIKVAANISLTTKALDFTSDELDLQDLDGILMANSLHYVKDQRDFLNKLLVISNHIVIVEYDTDKSNTWVPYPISFDKLVSMNIGKTIKIGAAPSQYHNEGIYSASILL